MPTKEWLEQHEKVAAYLKPELFERLSVWMEEKNISQISQAIVVILEHYLNDHPTSEISSELLREDVELLKKEICLIKACLVEAEAKSLAPKMQSEIVIAPAERMKIEYTEEKARKELTKSELCNQIGLTIYQANKVAQDQGISDNDYLLKVTGWQAGEVKRPRYYPTDN